MFVIFPRLAKTTDLICEKFQKRKEAHQQHAQPTHLLKSILNRNSTGKTGKVDLVFFHRRFRTILPKVYFTTIRRD